ncbi:MAG: hypothetical protein LBL15_00975 [Oscillospiraceae bacterium]|jgi:hypothetical protein|nr:hypothetical protein [Oscillospiraceae bacterium]
MTRRIITAAAAAAALAALLILAFGYGYRDDSHTVVLPTPAADNNGNADGGGFDRVEITPDTVKTVLEKTIVRTESFSRSYTMTNLWDGGENVSTLSYSQNGENIRLSVDDGYSVRNILILGDDLYLWYDGFPGDYRSKLAESGAGAEADRFSGLITYEELMYVPREDILDAFYAEHAGQPCIFAAYKSGALGYVYRLYISIETGLLVSMEKYDGDTLIFTMASVSTELTTPPDSVFEIPVWEQA